MECSLVRYDAMCQAIAEAHRVDEVKDLRDKAMALEQYARQAKNLDAERKACEIRLRAERRAGELLKDMADTGQRATAGEPVKQQMSRGTTSAPTLTDLGISRDQSSRWQKLANVPAREFEAALADPVDMPTTGGILRKQNGGNATMNPGALWLWGRLRDFEKDRIADVDPALLLGVMTQTMVADVARIAPIMRDYLDEMLEVLSHDKH
jgi:hypothetical protein